MSTDCVIEAGAVFTGADSGPGTKQNLGIRVADGNIAEISPTEKLRGSHPGLPRHGGPEFVAMPGMVNAHHHFGVTPLMQAVPFAPLELWLPRFRAMRRLPARLDTLFSAIEMLESGTTAVQHILSGLSGSPEDWGADAGGVLDAYHEIGMRAGFCFMVRDQNVLTYRPDAEFVAGLPPHLRDWIVPQLDRQNIPVAEQMDFLRGLAADRRAVTPDQFRFNVAPANLHWCSDSALEMLFATAREISGQIHMHLAETERQAHYARERFGCSAVVHLHRLGLLDDNVTFGHGNWLTGEDLDILAGCRCCVCHNASSGLRLGSGIAPVNQMRARGLPVALGIDQSNIFDDRDMLAEIKLVWALHRETGLFNSRPDAAQILGMATENGAQSLGFGGLIGRLEPGYGADIVLLDRRAMERPAVSPTTGIADTILHRARSDAVSEVFVSGRKVVSDGRVVSIDRDAFLDEVADRISAPLTDQELLSIQLAEELVTHLEADHRGHTTDSYRPYRYNAFV